MSQDRKGFEKEGPSQRPGGGNSQPSLGKSMQFRAAGTASMIWGGEAAGPGHAQALMPGPGSSLCPWGAGEPWENTKQGGTGQLRGPAGMDGRGKPGNWEVGEEDGMRVQGERLGPGPEL